PGYLSTVDSGNLAGHLIALRQACLSLADEPVFDARIWRALETALALANERLETLTPGHPALEYLKEARVALVTSRREAPGAAALARVAEPLSRAEAALTGSRPGPRVAEPAGEWISWSLRLIAAHTAWIEGLEVRPFA